MAGPSTQYVIAAYRDGHFDMTKVPDKKAANRVTHERYFSEGANVVKVSSSPPNAGFLERDKVQIREYHEPLLSEHHLPLPVRKGSRY